MEDIAYVIFTSGSTGKPKGILQTHRCLNNFARWQVVDGALTAGARILQFAATSFDVSVQEIAFSLGSGGCLFPIAPELRHDVARLGDFIVEQGIEIIDVPFSVLAALLHEGDWLYRATAIRHVISAGEPLHLTDSLRRLLEARPELVLHNHYGPSETHMLTAHAMCAGDTRGLDARTPVGKPIWNMRAHVLDEFLAPVEIGAEGEIYISGAGLARGYIDPDETRERFIDAPWDSALRLYRSLDVGLWLPDGNLKLLGRRDHQVKVRGVRIELEEVELAILDDPSVSSAAVTTRPAAHAANERELELVAYVCTEVGTNLRTLRDRLTRTLPAAMVPSLVVRVDALPRSPNGKIDREGLAELAADTRDSGEPPVDRVEAVLRYEWAALLGIAVDAAEANFIDLGGNSLQGARLAARIAERLGIEIGAVDLLENPVLGDMARILRERRGTEWRAIPRIPTESHHVPSSGQQRIWLLSETSRAASRAYTVTLVYDLDGPLDVNALKRALRDLVVRHEVLRSRFEFSGASLKVICDPEPDLAFESGEFGDVAVHDSIQRAILDEWERPFDLRRGPLLRAFLARTDERRAVLALFTHHLVCDGWSVTVFERDLFSLYAARVRGRPASLPVLPLRFRDSAAHEAAMADAGSASWQQSLEWWHDELFLAPFPRPPARGAGHRGAFFDFEVEPAMLDALVDLCRAENASLFAALAMSAAMVLARTSGTEEVVIGMPVAGRDEVALEEVGGFFANSLPLRLRLSPELTVGEHVQRAGEAVRGVLRHRKIPLSTIAEQTVRANGGPVEASLFEDWVVLQSEETARFETSAAGLRAARRQFDVPLSMFTRSFQFSIVDGRLKARLQYDCDALSADQATILGARLQRLIERLEADRHVEFAKLDLRLPPEHAIEPLEVFDDFRF